MSSIQDAETVRRAAKAGPGKFIDEELGGKLSKLSGGLIRGYALGPGIKFVQVKLVSVFVSGLLGK